MSQAITVTWPLLAAKEFGKGDQTKQSNQDSPLGLGVVPPFPEPITAHLTPGLN